MPTITLDPFRPAGMGVVIDPATGRVVVSEVTGQAEERGVRKGLVLVALGERAGAGEPDGSVPPRWAVPPGITLDELGAELKAHVARCQQGVHALELHFEDDESTAAKAAAEPSASRATAGADAKPDEPDAVAPASAATPPPAPPKTHKFEITAPEGAQPGSRVRVTLLDGRSVNITLPPGTVPGARLRVAVPPATGTAAGGPPAPAPSPASAPAAAPAPEPAPSRAPPNGSKPGAPDDDSMPSSDVPKVVAKLRQQGLGARARARRERAAVLSRLTHATRARAAAVSLFCVVAAMTAPSVQRTIDSLLEDVQALARARDRIVDVELPSRDAEIARLRAALAERAARRSELRALLGDGLQKARIPSAGSGGRS